jgi:CheY-like chemotaxis protein
MVKFNLTDSEKASLFDRFFSDGYEELIQIDPATETAVTLFSTNADWKRMQSIRFNYEDISKKYIMDISSDPDPENIIKDLKLSSIEQALDKSPVYRVHYTAKSQDGSLRLKEAYFIRNNDIIILTIHDITDTFQNVVNHTKELESALESAQQEIRQKNLFMTLMSRNIRTPLYSILGLTRIAENDFVSNSSIEDYLHKISMSGSYMNESINDILDLRGIASHEIELQPVKININGLLEKISRHISNAMQEKGLIYTLQTEGMTDLTVMADQHCLQQILMKLLKSAISYTVKGGRIELHARELMHSQQNVTIEFSVVSLGIVIDQERFRLLFKPHDYLKDKIDDDLGSIDIDLIILKSYINAMGADTLTAESDASRGTRISVTLTMPLSEEAQLAYQDTSDQTCPDFSGKRALIVDDNDINLEIGVKLMERRGMTAVTAKDGAEAIEIYKKERGNFDVILMDILMPGMDGLEATRRIRKLNDIPGSKQIPIIAMTANAFRENFEESFKAGLTAHLVKPIEPDRLYATIADALHM